jgi:hypothetical protein
VPADVADRLTVGGSLDQQQTPVERNEASTLGKGLCKRPRREPEVVELTDGLRFPGALIEERPVIERRLAEPDRRTRLGDGAVDQRGPTVRVVSS